MSDKTTKSKAKSAGAKAPADRLAKAEATREPIHVDYKGIEFDIPPQNSVGKNQSRKTVSAND